MEEICREITEVEATMSQSGATRGVVGNSRFETAFLRMALVSSGLLPEWN